MDEGGNGIGMQVTGSVDSGLDKNGLGLDVGGGGGAGAGAHSRDSSGPGRSANATPINGNGNGNGRNGRGRVSGQKRSRADDDEDDGGDEDESDAKPVKKAVAAKKTSTQVASHLAVERELELDNEGAEGEQDMTPYCICQRHSYGEMIGCDNDDCDFEWVRPMSSSPHQSLDHDLDRMLMKRSSTWHVSVSQRLPRASGLVPAVRRSSSVIRRNAKRAKPRPGNDAVHYGMSHVIVSVLPTPR